MKDIHGPHPHGPEPSHIDHKFQGKESFLSSTISLSIKEVKPNIPDGGWGWFVVFAAFTLNAISEGVTFTFGFLYIEFLEEFKASKSATSWIGSLFMAVPLLTGPLASALVDKYGCKYSTIVGGVITAIGFVLSAYAQSIGVMYLTYGVLGGIGRGVTYVTAVVAIAFWFEKRRSVALGLAASGTGFGTIVFSPLTTALLAAYGWRGTLLVTAGIFGNMCVCGMLMRDPDWLAEEVNAKGVNKKGESISQKASRELERLNNRVESQALLEENIVNGSANKTRFTSVQHLPTYTKHEKADNTALTNKELAFVQTNFDHKNNTKNHAHTYLKNLKYKRNSVGHRSAMINIQKYKVTASSCPDIYKNTTSSPEERKEKWYGALLDILKELSDFSIFQELHFLLFGTAITILFIWFIVPYYYLADHMTRIGFSEAQASFALAMIGFTNTVGMVGLGWIGDKLNVAKTFAVCLILCGISILAMMYFTNNYILLIINCALFGLFFASCFSLSPSLLSQLVPLDKFTMAYGMELLCEGVGNLTGPPLAGFFFDLTGSWELSFYLAGVWIIISGLLIGVIAYTKNRRVVGSQPVYDPNNTGSSSHPV